MNYPEVKEISESRDERTLVRLYGERRRESHERSQPVCLLAYGEERLK
jgi:hypothetical protein